MKALERQLAAQKIELDTRKAWAHWDIHQGIDLKAVGRAMYDASYTVDILDFDVTGRVEETDGRAELVIKPHGQRLPWSGKGPTEDKAIRIRLIGKMDSDLPLYEMAPDKIDTAGPSAG